MDLPAASINRGRALGGKGFRKHLLIVALLAGCATNHAIWKHAGELRAERAADDLRESIEQDNKVRLLTGFYQAAGRP